MVARRSQSGSPEGPPKKAVRREAADRQAEVAKLRKRLKELRSAGEDLLSDAAHAIRSPLTVTHSYLELLVTDLSDGLTEEQQSFLGVAHENIVRLRNLVEDMVELAALETGTAQIDLAPASINTLVESLRSEMQPIAEREKLEMTIEATAQLPTVMVDEKRLRDALRRLLDNAIRFTPEGGSLLLRVSEGESRVVVEVIDDGIGIPAEGIEESFRPFAQLHRKAGETREGFGLGLPLCRCQVEAFGGSLELESTQGEGTTVTIWIQVHRDQ